MPHFPLRSSNNTKKSTNTILFGVIIKLILLKSVSLNSSYVYCRCIAKDFIHSIKESTRKIILRFHRENYDSSIITNLFKKNLILGPYLL